MKKNSNFAKKSKPSCRKTTIVFKLYGLNEEEQKVIIEATKVFEESSAEDEKSVTLRWVDKESGLAFDC